MRPSESLRAPLLHAFCVACLAFCALSAPAGAKAPIPFAVRSHEIRGLIRQVWPLRVSRCARAASDLLVLSTVGGPPNQEKRLTWMPCGSALTPGDPRIIERTLPDETVVVDVAGMPGRSGPQLFLVSAAGIRIEALGGSDPPKRIEIPGGLPLPYRPWEISRIPVVDDWDDLGPPTALVPALRGAWLVDLQSDSLRTVDLPVYAQYRTYMPEIPSTVWKWMIQEVKWPTLARADDNGDGRIDLFALSRWNISIYHTGPEGLPRAPSRQLELIPFDEETERSHEATGNNYFARDIDGDTRADLLLSTIGGGLMDGRSTTRIHLNSGTGVSVDETPDAERTFDGGVSSFSFVDVDGDGRDEILETSLEFGILQIVRFLLTRRAETRVRVLRLDPGAPGGTHTIFEDDFSFRLNFGKNSVTGLVPSLGDWNGDGVKDFFVARGKDEIAFRMGSRVPNEPIFGSAIARQPVPLPGGESRVADLDGDGLDEIIAFNDRDPALPLVVFENLGNLPGTRPRMASGEQD
ncbi:MAG: VCBS repeat-containing protein [bacterium]|nr:VCBS repeat-containing protein [bacterium]